MNQKILFGIITIVSIAGIFVALTWRVFFPEAKETLFPSLAFNLLFLLPGVLWAVMQNKQKA